MRRSLPGFIALIAGIACAEPPVSWSDVVTQDVPAEPRESVSEARGVLPAGCEATLRIARSGSETFAAWFNSHPDSTAELVVARLQPAGWAKPVIADSTDDGTRGCGRPAPSIAIDPMNGYVHLAYFIEPRGGGGVFFAHSMDSGATFHAPVPIVYGKNPSRTSVASHGDRVVVAYEDPNSNQPLIGLALSRTTGHIFEDRVVATSNSGRALQPVVRVGEDSVRLWWSEYSANPAVSATRPRYRAGKWN
jgi:hypothetical protein